MKYTVHAFYRFVALPDYRELQPDLLARCRELDLIGTILLAGEGINGTLAGSADGLEAFWRYLDEDARFSDMEPKVSEAEDVPFYRMKVRLKKEIVTLGVPGVDPNHTVGRYVKPEDWNELIRDPDVFLIDTRNDYEVSVGRFMGAHDPRTSSFRDFPNYVKAHLDPASHKRVAMYCTGGIRCEKATAYLLQQGFEEVYHLQGGILSYLEHVPQEESLWDGECFVFDQRVTVDHDLRPGEYGQCFACRRPLTQEDLDSELFEEGVSCPACYYSTTEEKKRGARERERQVRLAQQRDARHLGFQADGGG